MSRTDRHRPYWVQSVEHGTEEHHQHELLGQPKTHRRKKRDKRGRVIMAIQPVTVSLYKAVTYPYALFSTPADDKRIRELRAEAKRRIAAGEYQWESIDSPEMKEQPVYEEHLLGHYADYCTIDEKVDRDERVTGHADLYAPCTRGLDGIDRWPAFGRSRGERGWAINRDHRRPSRRQVRNAERALAKDADTWVESDLEALGTFSR